MNDTMANGGAEQYRLFLAVALPQEAADALEAAQSELKRAAPTGAVRWTRREQWHLTLRFLGNVEAQRVEALAVAVRSACQGFSPLKLRAAQIGFFPDPRRPRVIWAGVQDQQGQLPLLHHALQSATTPFTTEEPEERFRGHITLGRIKMIRRPEAERLTKAAAGFAERIFGEWTADAVELMRSELSSQGPKYTCLGLAPLTGPS